MRLNRFNLTLLPATLFALPTVAQDRVQFSVDWNSPTVGLTDCTSATPITEGDILSPCGGIPGFAPLATPMIVIPGGFGGLGLSAHAGCVGHLGGTPCGVEVDAFSHGTDDRFQPNFPVNPGDLWFSVDEFAVGFPGVPAAPNLLTEAPAADAAADVMIGTSSLPPAPMAPVFGVYGHVGALDGDGAVSLSGYVYPGLGLLEPTPPIPSVLAGGDNLDAFNLQAPGGAAGSFYSLDGSTSFFDPCTGLPSSSSASIHGFLPGDVLMATTAGAVVYAPALALGLDLLGGPGSDDLDALILAENGDGTYSPSVAPYDWAAGGTDMLMFSVRRGSAVIGAPDSIFGLPIEEGDILVPPVASGVSPFPGIWVPAENLGLATLRSGLPGLCSGDELDALDHRRPAFRDCNSNNVEDAIDIVMGTSLDTNLNGIPDECEGPVLIATPYCFCAVGPCLNNDPTAGCMNSTGVGALLVATGSSDVVADDLVLTATQLPPFQMGLVYMGTVQVGPFPFGDGLRCAGGNACRLPVQNSGASGTLIYGPGIGVLSAAAGCPLIAGDNWNFQAWYRDPGGPCMTGFNLSNAVSVTFY